MAKESALHEARRRFNEVSQRVRSDGGNWSEFLTCAARNHKYNFQDQLLIYDQRPYATACADFDLWHDRFNRFIEKGTKSVRLLSPDGNSVKHVFDITDTRPGFGHEFDEPPYVWQIEPEDSQDVSERLNQVYGASGELGEQISKISSDFAERFGDSSYSELLRTSAEYYLRVRCGLETRAEDFNFENISELDGNTVMRLGNAVNNFARQVLDNVERAVRNNHERRKLGNGEGLEQNSADSLADQLHDGRGAEPVRGENIDGAGNEARRGHDDLSGSRLNGIGEIGFAGGNSDEGERGRNDLREDSGRLESVSNAEIETATPAPDEVRENAPEISRGVESSDGTGTGRESSDSLRGDSGTGESDEARLDEPIRAERPAAGQEPRPDGLGSAHEQPRNASGRNRNEDADLQLGFDFSAAQENSNADVENVDENEEPRFLETVIDLTPKSQPQETQRPSQLKQNFHITDDSLGVGGAKSKFKNNVEAIRTLKKIEREERLATSEEQEVLSRYVGWGGISQAFDENNSDWTKEYTELKGLLTEEEYNAARGSTLNAHYTSPMVIRSMYETLERMGFSKGNILEPSCGTGNFFGVLPESMERSKLYGVELDSITGRIAKQLYQKADIKIDGYERTKYPDNFFDVAVGNVPFGSYSVVDGEHKYNQENFRIHDYFFAKTLDKVRPGGVVAFITSKGTLDKANHSVRRYLAQRAELLGAVRLPNNAFKDNAGTQVTTDIVFLQKREKLVDDIQADWIYTRENKDGIRVNNYFANRPEMILGKMAKGKSLYGNDDETTCEPIEGANLQEQLHEALGKIQGRIEEREIQTQENVRESIPADPSVRNFSYTLVNNELYYRENSQMYKPDLPATAVSRAKGMVRVRDACREVINAQMDGCSDERLAELQKN